MTDLEFIDEEFQFLDKVKHCSSYLRMKEISYEIEKDEKLISLAKERDSYFSKSLNEEEEEKKQNLLLLFSQKDDELRNQPLMKEYLSLYQPLQKLMRKLSDELTRKMKS